MANISAELGLASSIESMAAMLEAEREIYRTFCNYLLLVDCHQQYERACHECFAPHAEIIYRMASGPPTIFNGPQQFLAYLESHARSGTQMSAHVMGQSVITWSDGKPRLSAYITAWHWLAINKATGDSRPADWTTIGFAEDDFEYIAGRWLISRRSVKPAAGLVAMGSATA
jgi:hypothetical protein